MLIELKLKNVALIEIIEINFQKGLNVFTGDSGSGKSLILDSLDALFGGTNIPIKHLIRPDKSECLIQARFELPLNFEEWIAKKNIKKSFSEILISRKTFKNDNKFKTKFYFNGVNVNKQFVKELGLILMDFAGQSDTSLFGSSEYRRTIIDELGSDNIHEINKKVKINWKKLCDLKKQLIYQTEEKKKNEESNFAVLKMLKILDQANLSDQNEIIKLENKESRLSNNFELTHAFNNILSNLGDSSDQKSSVSELILDSLKQLNKSLKYDQKISNFLNQLIAIQSDLESLIVSLTEYFELLSSNDESLEEVQHRLFFLKDLQSNFSMSIPELIKKRNELKKKTTATFDENSINELSKNISSLEIDFCNLLKEQSKKRKDIAKILEINVLSGLKNLGLKNASFHINFVPITPNSNGKDEIEFLFSANPDQELAPLSKIISGGEMSRFLLALKSSIAKTPNTFFFDEIDSGLSGKSLTALIKLIMKIANKKQVLCITHHPIIAASANVHFKVDKKVVNGTTYTSLTQLQTHSDRQNELVEMIGGDSLETNNYASKLLNKSAA